MRNRPAVGTVGLMGLMLLSPCVLADESLSSSSSSQSDPGGPARSQDSTRSSADTDASSVRLSMDFQNAALKDVLKVFSQQTGINVIAGEEVSDQTVTLYFEEVSPLDALTQILDAASLTYERPAGSGIYVVKSKPKKPPISVQTRVYRLKYARVSSSRLARAIEALGASTPFEAQQLTSAALSAGSSGGSASTTAAVGTITAKEIGVDKVIEKLLTKEGRVTVDERTNRLIVTDIPENFPHIEAVIKALDVDTAQILIDAELLETSVQTLDNLGFQWAAQTTNGDLFKFTPGSARTARFPFGIFGEGIAPTNPTRFGLSTLDFTSAQGILQALHRDTNTKLLARPKVLTLENESAVIRLTSREVIGFTVTSTSTGTTTATPERTTTGVILTVTPQLNMDGYITMLVEPSVTQVVSASVQPPTSVGGTVVNPETRSARSLVRIRDHETLVLGGLINHNDTTTLRRVPILGDVPVIGEAFKNRVKTGTNTELVVFITPHIVSQPMGTQVASLVSPAPFPVREQDYAAPRQAVIEQTLKRLEHPPKF